MRRAHPTQRPRRPRPQRGGRKRGLRDQIAAAFAAEVERLATLAADALGSGAGVAPVELAIRTAMIQLGAELLQQLLAADTGHRGPRIDCGEGHLAEFIGYRDKRLDTVLGRISVRRAYYHCAVCEHGIAPRDDDLGVTGASLSPGLRSMTARAAAAQPFAAAADLLAELAGIRLSAKRIERSAETDGAAAAERITAESAAITRRRVAVLPAPGDRGHAPDKLYIAIDGTGVPMVPAATPGGPARAATAGPAPARSNLPACSPRPGSTSRAGQCATPIPPATWAASPPPSSSPPWWPRRSPPPRRR